MFNNTAVKHGYNELGYNKHPVLTNKMNPMWTQLVGFSHIKGRFFGYNEQNPVIANKIKKKLSKIYILSSVFGMSFDNVLISQSSRKWVLTVFNTI